MAYEEDPFTTFISDDDLDKDLDLDDDIEDVDDDLQEAKEDDDTETTEGSIE